MIVWNTGSRSVRISLVWPAICVFIAFSSFREGKVVAGWIFVWLAFAAVQSAVKKATKPRPKAKAKSARVSKPPVPRPLPPPLPAGDMRIADADRNRLVDHLREQLVVGRLTSDEFGQRIEAALQAKTWDDARAITRDLPPQR